MQNRNIEFFCFFILSQLSSGANLPTTCPFTTCLLELYQECMENSVWAHVLYEVWDGIEKLTFLLKAMPPSSRHPGWRPASERRRACDKRLREAWAERKRICSQACPLPRCSLVEEATAVAVLTTTVVAAAAAFAKAVIASPLPAQCLRLLFLCRNVWKRWPFDPEADMLSSQREGWCSSLMGGIRCHPAVTALCRMTFCRQTFHRLWH